MKPLISPLRFAALIALALSVHVTPGSKAFGETPSIVAGKKPGLTAPAVKTQEPSKNTSAERERMRRIMDPATDVEEFRRELDSFYADLQSSMNGTMGSEFARDLLARAGLNPLGQLADARKLLPGLTAQDLGVLKAAFTRNPNWRELPDQINSVINPRVREALKRIPVPKTSGRVFSMSAVMPPEVTTLPGGVVSDNCEIIVVENSSGEPAVSNSDISILEAAAIAAEAVEQAIPEELLGAKEVAIAAEAAAKGLALAAETFKRISDDCLTLDFQNYVTANLDTQVSTLATQTSVNNLQTSVNTLQTSVNNLQSTVNTGISTIVTDINNAETAIINNDNTNTTNIINNTNADKAMIISELRTVACEVIRLLNTPMGQRSSNIQSCVGQPGFPYDFNHNGGAHSKSARAAATVTGGPNPDNTPASRGQDGVPVLPLVGTVTMEIHLLEGRLIPTYYLPSVRGGMIEQVQLLVWNTINSQVELDIAKDRTEQARQIALQADQLLNQKKYVEAYRQYSLAYQTLVPAS